MEPPYDRRHDSSATRAVFHGPDWLSRSWNNSHRVSISVGIVAWMQEATGVTPIPWLRNALR